MFIQIYIGLLSPLAKCYPLGKTAAKANTIGSCQQQHLLMNEIALNYGLNSYLELHAQNGMSGNLFSKLHFGLMILQPNKDTWKTHVKALINLERIRSTTVPNKQYIVVGSPKRELLPETTDNYLTVGIGSHNFKIFGDLNNFLKLNSNDHLMVILTCSEVASLVSKLTWNPNTAEIFPKLEEQPDLVEYIGQFQIDAVIIRGKINRISKCSLLENLVFSQYKVKGKMKPYLNLPLGTDKSISNCGVVNQPFTLHHYSQGRLTPGAANSCDGSTPYLSPQLDTFSNLYPSSTATGDSCSRFEDISDFDVITGEQINVAAEETAMRISPMIEAGSSSAASANSGSASSSAASPSSGADSSSDTAQSSDTTSNSDNASSSDTSPNSGAASSSDTSPSSEAGSSSGECQSSTGSSSSTSEHRVCLPRHIIRHDVAGPLNEIHSQKAKRIKLMTPLTEYCTDTLTDEPLLQLPFERERRRHIAMAVEFITKNLMHKFTKIDDVLKAHEWFQLLPNHHDEENSKYNCFYCSKFADDFRIKHKTSLASKEGVMYSKEENHRRLRDHAECESHKHVMEKFQLKHGKGSTNRVLLDLLRGESVEFYVTNNHLRAAFWLAKEGVAIEKYESFIGVQARSGGKFGDFCRTDTIGRAMVKSISTVMFEELKESLTDSKAPLSILAGLLFFQVEYRLFVKNSKKLKGCAFNNFGNLSGVRGNLYQRSLVNKLLYKHFKTAVFMNIK